jgi:TRAP-type C4-dicarboxylate transport system substrate-binding protein
MRRLLLAALLAAGLAAPAGAQTRWVLATGYPDASFQSQNVRRFATEVEQASGGRLAIQVHTAGTLLPLPQIKRAVQTGQIQLGEIALSVHGNEDAVFEVDSVPFLAETWADAAALTAASEPLIRGRMQRQGLELLSLVNWPSQGFYTRTPISGIEDFRGVRLRSFNAITVRMAELMGAVPTTVQVVEIPQAFATNVIAAMFTSAQVGIDTAAWDYARVFTDPGSMRPRNAVVVNARALAALDEDLRLLLREAGARASARGVATAQEVEQAGARRLAAQGMTVAEPTPALVAQFRAVGATLVQEWTQRAGADGQELITRYTALRTR